MANIKNTKEWVENVRQIEVGDRVIGGTDAPINICLSHLVGRTGYLKDKIDAVPSDSVAGLIKISSVTNSDAEDTAASLKAVKVAYDKAVAAEEAADGAVKTTANQEIAGDKTFTGLTTLKKGAIVADSVGDFNANQYLQIGSNNVNSYLHNKKSGKYLSMRNDGELRYDGKRLLNVDDLAGMIPSGAVMYFAGQTAPSGWLKANGAAVSRTTYAALFAAIGTTYGAGDGRSTFNLPDLRAEFLRGWDDGRGIDSGRAFGSAQRDAIRNIKGSLEALYGSQRYTLYTKAEGAFATDSDDGANTTFRSSTDDHAHRQKRVVFDASRSVPVADEVRPKALVMVLCIKAQNSLDDVVMWIKAFGKITNAGTLDAATLAADIQRKANRDEVAPKAHTHRAADITDFAQAVGNLFAAQKAASGCQKMADGIIFEWGSLQVPDDGFLPVVFPVAFPNACLNVQATVVFDNAATYSYVLAAHAGKITKTGCHVGISENGIVGSKTVHWLAIGY